MRRLLLPVLITASLAAACGEEVEDRAVERDTPAITSPGTTIPYENGGGDGSGADGSGADGQLGSEDPEDRGGIGAGPDSSGERE